MTDLSKIVQDTFPHKRVVIVGDLVADQFLNGTISRVSREAPVFILRHDNTETVPGAAANAAANVASLGGTPLLVGVIGSDPNGDALRKALDDAGVDTRSVLADDARTTTTKVRVLAGQHYAARQQVIRIDYESTADLAAGTADLLEERIAEGAETAHAIIVSDYGCGTVSERSYAAAKRVAEIRGIPLIVDSRYRLRSYAGATTATPNREEVEQILGHGFSAADCERLRDELSLKALLVTNGNRGMTIFERDEQPLYLDAVGSTEPVDVTGAGDTVIAAYALALASGASFSDAARIANHAGGLVVMKKGTACVSGAELAASLTDKHPAAVAQGE